MFLTKSIYNLYFKHIKDHLKAQNVDLKVLALKLFNAYEKALRTM